MIFVNNFSIKNDKIIQKRIDIRTLMLYYEKKGKFIMKKSFASLTAPVYAAVIREKTPTNAICAIKNAEINGATAFDLHLSCLEQEYRTVDNIRNIVECTSKPMLGLNYNITVDKGGYACSEEDRIALLLMAVDAGISAVDFQGYTYDLLSKDNFVGEDIYSFTKNNPKEIVTDEKIIKKQKALIDKVHKKGAEVLLSCHPNVFLNKTQVVDLAKFMEERNPDIIKIITVCNTEEEMVQAFETMVALKNEIKSAKIHFHCTGKTGKLTRIVNPLLGAYMTFCVDRYAEGHTVEQLHLKTFVDVMDGIKKLL